MEILTVALATFFGGIAFVIARNGFMAKITFHPETTAPMHLVYRLHLGEYTKTSGQIKQLEKELDDAALPHGPAFGIFMDNPHTTETGAQRALVGRIVPEAPAALPDGVAYVTFPASDNISTTFPYKGEFSIAMGAVKVYTALRTYRQKNSVDEAPVMEIYDKDAGVIRYLILTGIASNELDQWTKA